MSTRDYNPATAERKWQRVWEERGTFRASRDPSREKFYVLEMFPYPSGRIHVGHVRNYTLGDVLARYKRANGFSVLHPMGWDAFGLPAENAARDRGIHPGRWTRDNIAAMREQLRSMGFSLDWSREFATCDVEYYGAQQALFLDFLEAGCVYRRSAIVNWDPVDQTVLANEQVIDGRGWRSNAVVERREMTQWFFRISDFAEELLAAEERLEGWPDRVRLMQRNWIGRSEGLRLDFALEPSDIAPDGTGSKSSQRDMTRFSAPALSRFPPIIPSRGRSRPGFPGSTRSPAPAGRSRAPKRRSAKQKSAASIPDCGSAIRSIRTGGFPYTWRTSSCSNTARVRCSAAPHTTSAIWNSPTATGSR